MQFSFEVGIVSIFSQLSSSYKTELKKNYCIVDKGYNSFPTNLPGSAYQKAIRVRFYITLKQMMRGIPSRFFDSWLFQNCYDFVKARERITQIVSEIIIERKEKKLLEKDLLGHLLNYKDDNGQTLTEDQIADNIIGVLFAARDTTASVITWILKYLHDDRKLLEAVKVTTTLWSQMVLPGSNYILLYVCFTYI